MRFHLTSFPHTETTAEFMPCAYTQKAVKLSRMLMDRGHEVFLYAGEANEAPCTEHITVVTHQDQEDWFGPKNPNDFYPITWDANDVHWRVQNHRTVAEIMKRWQKRDRVLIAMGQCQQVLADTFAGSIEHGIGYQGVCSNTFRCYESNAWMHYVQGVRGDDNGHHYDAVIPNYFDPDDFPLASEQGDYLLFVGRFALRKGVEIAAEIAKRTGLKLIMAGQGVLSREPGKIIGAEVTVVGEHVTHIGTINAEQRGKLMSEAKAVLVPTTYLEPFGGVNVEAQMCGTPVITTNFGAFPETVIDHVTGYRFSTIGEAVWGVEHVDDLDRQHIRDLTVARYSLERVGQQYEAWFQQIDGLWDKGGDFYTQKHAGTSELQRYVSTPGHHLS